MEQTEINEFEHHVKPQIKAAVSILLGIFGTIGFAWLLGGVFGSFMQTIQNTFWYHFLPFIFSLSLFSILIYKAYVKNIHGLSFLSSAVLLHGIAEFISMISEPTGTIFNRNGNYLAMFADLMFPIAVILIYLHVELIEKTQPDLIHAIGIMSTSIPIIVGGALLIILEPIPLLETLKKEIYDVVVIYLGFFALIILWISLFGLRIMYGNLKHADSPGLARASMFVLIGFSSLLTNFILLGTSYSYTILDKPLIFKGSLFKIYNTWLITIALLFMILAYVLVPEFAYTVNFDVYQLLVLHAEQGITLFSFVNEFRQKSTMTHDALKSPAIIAIRDLVREVASAKGYVLLLKLSDRMIIMETYKEIVTVLISEKESYFLKKGIKEFTKSFYEQFQENIVNFNGDVGIFESGDLLVTQTMPFMRKKSLTREQEYF